MATALDELVAPPEEQAAQQQGEFQNVAQSYGMSGASPLDQPPPPPPPTRDDQLASLGQSEQQLLNQLPNQNRFAARQTTAKIANVRFQRQELQRQQQEEDRATRYQQQEEDRAQRQSRQAEQQQQQGNRLKASDLADRGIPTYRDAAGGVSPVTDETGAPMLHMDKRNNIAYDSQGNPKVLSYEGETGPPALKDPFAGAQVETDPKTGEEYQKHPGLPWNWVGTDPAIKSQRMQETKDKALASESQLLGRKLSMDHADLVAGDAEVKAMTKELQASVPALQDPRLQGADRDTIMGAINDHFNTEYAQPSANETNGWFSKELSPSAQQLRQHIDTRKADAMQTASDLFDLKQDQAKRADAVSAGRAQIGTELDTLIAHKRGQPGPLDQPPEGAAPVGAEGAAPQMGQQPQVDPQTIADAKAGKKPYTIDDQNNVVFDPKNLGGSIQQAATDGLVDPQRYAQLKPQLDELQKATDDRQKLLDAAGSNPKLKAILSGAVKGSAFLAGFPIGAGVGAAAGAAIPVAGETGIPEVAGSIIGGLISGTIASKGAEAIIKNVGEYNDTIHPLSASSELHPNYDAAGNLISFAAGGIPGAAKLAGRGFEALAGGAEGIVKTGANAIARSYYGSGSGLWSTIQNLSKDASIRAAQLGDQAGATTQIAKAIAWRVGGAAAANVAIGQLINDPKSVLTGTPSEGTPGDTLKRMGFDALVGAFMAVH
jgi:hypothetical protein